MDDYNSRWYSADLGRFISPDDIVPDLNNPQSLNRYSYVNNDPVNATDPTGHKIACDDGYLGSCGDSGYGDDPSQPASPPPPGGDDASDRHHNNGGTKGDNGLPNIEISMGSTEQPICGETDFGKACGSFDFSFTPTGDFPLTITKDGLTVDTGSNGSADISPNGQLVAWTPNISSSFLNFSSYTKIGIQATPSDLQLARESGYTENVNNLGTAKASMTLTIEPIEEPFLQQLALFLSLLLELMHCNNGGQRLESLSKILGKMQNSVQNVLRHDK